MRAHARSCVHHGKGRACVLMRAHAYIMERGVHACSCVHACIMEGRACVLMRASWTGAHLDGDGHERPALVADAAPLAARAHVVVIRQIDIEHQLTLLWGKRWVGGCKYVCASA